MEIKENQSVNSKKLKNQTNLGLEMLAKVNGVFKLTSFREILLLVLSFGLLIALLHLRLFPKTIDVKIGQISQNDIHVPRDVIDPEATRREQKKAEIQAVAKAKQDLSFYVIDPAIAYNITNNLNLFYDQIEVVRESYQNKQAAFVAKDEIHPQEFQSIFNETPNINFFKNLVLLAETDYQELKLKSHQILGVMESEDKLNTKAIKEVKDNLEKILDEYQVSDPVKPALRDLLVFSFRPNLVINQEKLDKLVQQIRIDVPPLFRRQGEVLIARNQVVTANDLKMLSELHLINDESNQIKVFLSLSFFVIFLMVLSWLYILQFHAQFLKQERMLYLLILLVLLVVSLIKAFALIDSFGVLPYLAPVSLAGMLITILIEPQIALAMMILVALLGGIIVDYNLALTIFYFISGVVAVLSLSHFYRQRDLVRSGLILAGSNVVIVTILNLLFRSDFNYVAVLLAAANGILAAILTIGTIPFLEHLFKVTSPIRLLELSNPGHPLLRRLQIEAPGTYYHSIMVGNLAEAAAEKIGADALWVRVGSYYHDIGKIKRPYFFVENQLAQENPHEKLNPTLSTLIITYHVKEGAEIAREHGLPEKLIEIIEQHHGTDLVRYFYRRATENLQGEKESLIEDDFRYEGPRPQSKEAALVMLADSVEAAVRSMPKLTPAKLESLIQKIIRERLDDGQFDESNLTLKDLNQVKNSFLKVLSGMFHNRIEYPESVLKEMERKKVDGSYNK